MNKKLLFATMSLAALAACTNDDFESKSIAEETSPVQFEVINIDDAKTRASMNDDNSIKWSAKDGDLFTLYHGASSPYTTGYENATYTANANDGATATLTTPTMIKQGGAVMVWPVDTTFRIKPTDALTIKIPAEQTNIVNNIPYMSDLIDVQAYAAYSETAPAAKPTAYTTAGKGRKYAVYMRPMASQLIVKADYAGSDATLAQLYEGGSAQPADGGIAEISVTSIDLLTKDATTTPFTTEIPVKFTSPGSGTGSIKAQWDAAVPLNVWSQITDFNIAGITGKTDKLSAKEDCLNGTDGCTVLILPQATISGGVSDGGVLVNTLYGRVVVAANGKTYASQYPTSTTVPTSQYTPAEYADAWYRYVSATTAAATGETKATTATPGLGYKTTANIEMGMQQTINGFSTYTKQSGVVKGEPVGAAATRYVKVLLSHLDMSDLHIKTDKHLRDAALVWKHLNLPDVTVLLDGKGAAGEFEISQKTIKVINDINASIAGGTKSFKVMPCTKTGETCETIVVTGASDIQNVQDMAFIVKNGTQTVDVALKAGETWKWGVDNKVIVPAAAVDMIINKGTLLSDATATIKTQEAPRATGTQNNVKLENNGTWDITTGTLNVQFDVTNNGTVNIAKNAQYRQDGQAQNTVFINEATDKPARFTYLVAGDDTKIGKVVNKGVFATVAATGKTANINNYGLIKHDDPNAKTYITTNQTTGASFNTPFSTILGSENKMGRINLPFSNKDEDNISVSAALAQGFVSVTVDGEVTGALDASVVGSKVNYVIVNSGITEIKAVSAQVKYLEINQPGTEIAWNVPNTTEYDGLIILSDVNIKLGTKIIATTTYLGADMYVGGKFNIAAIAAEGTDPAYGATNFSGYYGNTSGNVASKYITY